MTIKQPTPVYVRLVWTFVLLYGFSMGIYASYQRVKVELREEAMARHCTFRGERLVSVGEKQFCAREL